MKKNYYLINFILILCLSLFLIASHTSYAALNFKDTTSLTEKGAESSGVARAGDPTALAASIISALLSLVGVVFFILFLYGSIMWMTAAGNDEKVGSAKKIIVSSVIGLAIVSLAYVISFFVIQALEKNAL